MKIKNQRRIAKGEKTLFENVLNIVSESGIKRPFRLGSAINTALFDAVMYGIAINLRRDTLTSRPSEAYSALLDNDDFLRTITRATADEESVKTRLDQAEEKFKE